MATGMVIEILFWLGLAVPAGLVLRGLLRRFISRQDERHMDLDSSFEKHRALYDEHAA